MAEKILKIDTGKLRKSYSLNGVTKIEIKDTNLLFGTKSLNSLIKTASATGSTLSVILNNNTQTLLTFVNFKDIQKLPVIVYTETKNKSTRKTTRTVICTHEAGELADATLPKIGPITEPQKGTAVNGSILDDVIDLRAYDANTSKKITVKIDGKVGDDSIYGSKYIDNIKGVDGDDTIIASGNNDVIIGGIGNNKIYYRTDNFGDDTVILTKGENLTIVFDGDLENEKLEFSKPVKNKSDLLITTKEGTITIKNYLSKDLGATFKIINGAKEINVLEEAVLGEVNAANYFQLSPQKINTKYTGTAVADNINASELVKPANAKGTKTNAGVTINSMAGNDLVIGSQYNDTLKGGTGDDTITGGLGDDQLYGEAGTNTFVFNMGDGFDTITSGIGNDIIKFNDTSVSKLEFVPRAGKSYKDLVINYNLDENDVAQDAITIKNYYDKDGYAISSVKSIENEGRIFNIEQLIKYEGRIIDSKAALIESTHSEGNIIIANGSIAQTVNGGSGKDIIYASNSTQECIIDAGDGDDVIYGSNVARETGEDKYYTGSGDNIVYAGNSGITHIYLGNGDDSVYTSPESPTYIYIDGESAGGKDKIYWQGNNSTKLFFTNNTDDDIVFTRAIDSNNLVIRYRDNKNYVMIKDYFLEGNEAMATSFYIIAPGAEEKTLDVAIDEKGGVKTYIEGITGTEGNDYIYATEKSEVINAYGGNDYIDPQGGNDTITAGSGNDFIRKGNGDKTIYANSGNNRINLGTGNNVVYMGTGSDTVHSGIGNNTIIFKNLNTKNIQNITTYDNGNDTYKYGGGQDKQDRLLMAESLSDLVIDRREEDAVLYRGINYDEQIRRNVTIQNYNNYNAIADDLIVVTPEEESNLFNISTILGDNTKTEAQILNTGRGYDDIYTGFGDDTIIVGLGENTIHMYIAEEGNNNTFTRYQSDHNDTFVLEDNLNFNNIAFLKNGDDLLVGYTGDLENNTVNIVNYFKNKDLNDQHIIFKIDNNIKCLGDLYQELEPPADDDDPSGGDDSPGGNENPGGNSGDDESSNMVHIITSADADVRGTEENDIITAYGKIRQEIRAYDGDDIVYVSNNLYSNLVLTHAGDDTIHGSDTARIDGPDIYYTGPGNNTVYAGNNNPKIYLGYNNDTVHTSTSLLSSTDIYIDCSDPNPNIAKNGGRDTIYWKGCGHTNIIFENNSYSDMSFTRSSSTGSDLVLRYRNQNYITFKNYFKKVEENIGDCIFIQDTTSATTISISEALAEKGYEIYSGNYAYYGTTGADTINGTSGADLLYGKGNDTLNGKNGNDTYIVSSLNNSTTISDTGGTDTLNIKDNHANIKALFNVQKDGTFADGQNKLYIVNNTAYNEWTLSGDAPTSGIKINNFDVIEKIYSTDNYKLNNLNQLKESVAAWLTDANGGLGYDDVQAALTSGDANIGDLIAIFDNASWEQQV
ncbi:hypothetical protein IJI31_03725 [bacterium]|nr:hypothetical protein [bacterium]